MYARFLMCTEKSVSAQEGPHLRGNRAVLTSETSFVTSRLPLLLFIPCIEDNHFATLNPKNPQYCCLDICNITLNGQCDINIQCDIINIQVTVLCILLLECCELILDYYYSVSLCDTF